jgi:hypothetical protein
MEFKKKERENRLIPFIIIFSSTFRMRRHITLSTSGECVVVIVLLTRQQRWTIKVYDDDDDDGLESAAALVVVVRGFCQCFANGPTSLT